MLISNTHAYTICLHKKSLVQLQNEIEKKKKISTAYFSEANIMQQCGMKELQAI